MAKKRKNMLGALRTRGGLKMVYSPVNQAWFVMWHDQVLRVITSKREAMRYVRSIGG